MSIGFSKKILVFVGILVLGIGVGVGGMVVKEKFFTSEESAAQSTKKPDKIGPVIELKEFLVNLDGGGMLKTEITIEGVDENSILSIYDISGRRMVGRTLRQDGESIQIQTLTPGMYLLKIQTKEGIYISKFVKE